MGHDMLCDQKAAGEEYCTIADWTTRKSRSRKRRSYGSSWRFLLVETEARVRLANTEWDGALMKQEVTTVGWNADDGDKQRLSPPCTLCSADARCEPRVAGVSLQFRRPAFVPSHLSRFSGQRSKISVGFDDDDDDCDRKTVFFFADRKDNT